MKATVINGLIVLVVIITILYLIFGKVTFPDISKADSFVFILTILVAILSFLFAIIAFIEWGRIRVFTKRIAEFERATKEIKVLHESYFRQQDYYISNTFQTVLSAIMAITSQINDDDDFDHFAKSIQENMNHGIQITNLYYMRFNSHDRKETKGKKEKDANNKFSAFAYLEENGVMEDIPHLVYVAEHDPIKKNRNRAREIIGRIKEREREKEREKEIEFEQSDTTHKNEKNNHHNCFCSFIMNLFSKKD